MSKNINKQNTPFDTGPNTKAATNNYNNDSEETKIQTNSSNRKQTKNKVSST
jgi:hypothetical protein